MGRIAVWWLPVVLGVCACTFDFDAPFAESGGGGSDTSSGALTGPTTTTTTTASGSGGGASSSTGGDGGAGGDAATSGATSSAASAGGSVSVPCGDDPCTFDAGEGGCCWSPGDDAAECFTSPPSNSDCRTSAQLASREALLRCRDASDCGGGQRCCASYVLDGTTRVYSVATCLASCGGSSTPLCDPGDDDPCPLSEATCEAAPGLPPDYHGCFF